MTARRAIVALLAMTVAACGTTPPTLAPAAAPVEGTVADDPEPEPEPAPAPEPAQDEPAQDLEDEPEAVATPPVGTEIVPGVFVVLPADRDWELAEAWYQDAIRYADLDAMLDTSVAARPGGTLADEIARVEADVEVLREMEPELEDLVLDEVEVTGAARAVAYWMPTITGDTIGRVLLAEVDGGTVEVMVTQYYEDWAQREIDFDAVLASVTIVPGRLGGG